jgi:hypothetical protein
MRVALHPLKSDPLNPGGHVSGWQHEPSFMHTSPLGQVRHVMFGKPHPAATGWQEGTATVLQVFAWQHVPSKQVSFPQALGPQLIVFPEHGSFQVPHVLAGHVVFGVQQVA